jgi:Rhodanese-like domain
VYGCALKIEELNFMAKPRPNRTQQTEPAPPSRGPIIVLTAGSLAVAALVGWALTRTVEPAAPEASTVATSPAPGSIPPGNTGTEVPTAAPSAPAPAAEGEVPRISPEQLKQMVDTNAITLLDVRDSVSYTNGHIPGAIHIPFARVEAEASRLPKGKPVVAYCT